jgi:hypothetical protein
MPIISNLKIFLICDKNYFSMNVIELQKKEKKQEKKKEREREFITSND